MKAWEIIKHLQEGGLAKIIKCFDFEGKMLQAIDIRQMRGIERADDF